MLMSGLTDLVSELKVVTHKFVGFHAESLQRVGVGEIEHLRQRHRHQPQLAWQQILDGQPLSAGLSRQFRDHTRSRRAEVDDRIAVERVEAAAESTGSVAASRVKAAGLVAVALRRQLATGQCGDLARVERGHLSQ